ncbi:sugar phosphate isomerase/epimerase family protein [Terribacillus saccharophilus]|uniref:sugar phosphate isomerase/epimerase family protein n=1 Tax=Terribacillus saccharophilus TaxID=361277 RepID=UPI002989D2B2|nr:sugar phosphate isomerase/epimerase family protein [Terribacillus saccharophilus]MCM3224280.1 sugar phosphate isomerase/epimerase [Terribacillus saccharophilus]
MKFAYPVLTEETIAPSLGASGKYEDIFPNLSEIGYEAVELLIRDPSKIKTQQLLSQLDQASLKVASIGTGPIVADDSLTLSNPDQSKEAVKRASSIIDMASDLKSSVSLGKFRGSVQNKASHWNTLVSNLTSIIDYADRKNVEILFESQNLQVMDHLTNTKEMVNFINSYFTNANVNLMVDVFHIFEAGESINKSLKLADGRLSYVHISDSERRIPGEGEFDFKEIFTALKKLHYKGYITPEIKQSVDSIQTARKSLNYLKQYV